MLKKMARLRLCAAMIFAVSPATAALAEGQSVSLNEALVRAGTESPAVQVSQAEIDIARGNQKQASLGPNPEVSVDVENVAGSGVFNGLRSTEYTVSVGQRLELGGKRGARTRAARAQTSLAEIEAAISQAELASSVRLAYTEAVAAQSRLDFATRVVSRNRELARIASILVETGRDPPLRALRADAALGEAEAALEAARAEEYSARLLLASLWGSQTPPQKVEPVWLSGGDVEFEADLSQSLQIKAVEANRDAASAIVTRERANAVPDLTLSGGARRFEESGDTAFIVGASIAIPFGNRNQGSIQAAEASVRGAEARRALRLVEINREYNIASNQLEATQSRVETLESQTLPQAEEASRLAQLGYQYGKFTLLDVLDAAAARDTAELGLLEAKVARAEAVISLLRLAAK
ncbi:MAG: TolC family protein [Sphingomonadales bacterium]|nr:TolC family protein [Sphingomonadales bacterium]